MAELVNDPSDGGGSDVSHVLRKFSIGEIRAFTVIAVNPLASPPLLPPSDEGGDQSVYLTLS